MDDKKFEMGNVVKLKSGGPDMTITGNENGRIGHMNMYMCTWFVNGIVYSYPFHKDTLVKVNLDNKKIGE